MNASRPARLCDNCAACKEEVKRHRKNWARRIGLEMACKLKNLVLPTKLDLQRVRLASRNCFLRETGCDGTKVKHIIQLGTCHESLVVMRRGSKEDEDRRRMTMSSGNQTPLHNGLFSALVAWGIGSDKKWRDTDLFIVWYER